MKDKISRSAAPAEIPETDMLTPAMANRSFSEFRGENIFFFDDDPEKIAQQIVQTIFAYPNESKGYRAYDLTKNKTKTRKKQPSYLVQVSSEWEGADTASQALVLEGFKKVREVEMQARSKMPTNIPGIEGDTVVRTFTVSEFARQDPLPFDLEKQTKISFWASSPDNPAGVDSHIAVQPRISGGKTYRGFKV